MSDNSSHSAHLLNSNFDKPQDVVLDNKLSTSEKKKLLTEWKSSLNQITLNDPESDDVRSTIAAIDKAMVDLGE